MVVLCVLYVECDSMSCLSHRAAYDGDLRQLETLLEAGILSLDHRDQFGSTMLHKGIACPRRKVWK